MNVLKGFIILASFLTVTGCASFGPTVLIETPQPADDFVVVCQWYKMPLLEFHGGSKLSGEDVYVTPSGETINCGLGSGESTQVKVLHPIYANPEIVEHEGVSVYRYTKTKLDILDEQKAKFEVGFWDKHKSPGTKYARSLVGCGFPYQYFDYYSGVKKVDKEYFKALYHEPMLACFKRTYPITKKYDPQIGKQLPKAEEWMKRMWLSDKWSRY